MDIAFKLGWRQIIVIAGLAGLVYLAVRGELAYQFLDQEVARAGERSIPLKEVLGQMALERVREEIKKSQEAPQ